MKTRKRLHSWLSLPAEIKPVTLDWYQSQRFIPDNKSKILVLVKGFRGSPLGKHCELPQLRKYTARGCFNVQRDNICFTRPLFPKWIKTISIGGYSVIPKISKWEMILPVHVKHTSRIWWTYHFLNVLLSSRCLVATKSLPGAITHKHWSEFLENLNKIYEKVLVNYFSLERPWESRSSDNYKTLKRSFANVAYFVIYRSLYLTWITLPPEKKIWLQKKIIFKFIFFSKENQQSDKYT